MNDSIAAKAQTLAAATADRQDAVRREQAAKYELVDAIAEAGYTHLLQVNQSALRASLQSSKGKS